MRYKSNKSHIIFDALNRFFIDNQMFNDIKIVLNIENFHNNIVDFKNNLIYVKNNELIIISLEFKQKLQNDYKIDEIWIKILNILKTLNAQVIKKMKSTKLINTKNKQSNSSMNDVLFDEKKQIILIKMILKTSIFNNYRIDIDFRFIDDLIYYLLEYNSKKSKKSRLCISFNVIHDVFKLTHDDCFYIEHYRVYAKLIEFVYIHKLSRKLIIYIRYYFFVNSIKQNVIDRIKNWFRCLHFQCFFIR